MIFPAHQPGLLSFRGFHPTGLPIARRPDPISDMLFPFQPVCLGLKRFDRLRLKLEGRIHGNDAVHDHHIPNRRIYGQPAR